jgi:UDP-N-acetyl-D-mannosaminuronic acid transferase (WecB/TagA/CpsF family)
MRMRILGLDFFNGTAPDAVDRALDRRGLIVAPSGTCFDRLRHDEVYRCAVTNAEIVLPDSGFMVLLWQLLRGQHITRISGLAYLKELLARPDLRSAASTIWVLPNDNAREKAAGWLEQHGFASASADFYVAPMYGTHVEDPALLNRIQAQRPAHVIIALSGGVQEKLGFYLRENFVPPADFRAPTPDIRPPASDHRSPTSDLSRPAIHCIGAALGFVTGYQVAIPTWADRLYLGWLFRLVANPRKFFPRAISALSLPGMVMKYGDKLPPIAD